MTASNELNTDCRVAGTERTGQFATVYAVLQEAIASRAFPGCAFGVLANGRVVLADALGNFTYDDRASAVCPDTVFDIASLTKVVCTTAVAVILCERGILDLDTRLGDVLPAFVVGRRGSESARQVNIRNLLAHNSGLPGYVEFFRTARTPEALFRQCLQLPIEVTPGERAEYSDPGFILLGKALELLKRESLDKAAEREIFYPLGMSATGFRPPGADRDRIPPTEIDESLRHRVIQGEVQDENAWVLGGVAGHAGLFSNVPDLLRFSAAILASFSGEEAGVSGLFARETTERFAERQGPEGSSRALGWDTPSAQSSAGSHFSKHSIGHLGYSGCSLWIDLDASVAAVLLTNRTWPDRSSQAIRRVRPAFHDAVRECL
jgi:CubicO group peptidase (beta-lactamase class C family)